MKTRSPSDYRFHQAACRVFRFRCCLDQRLKCPWIFKRSMDIPCYQFSDGASAGSMMSVYSTSISWFIDPVPMAYLHLFLSPDS